MPISTIATPITLSDTFAKLRERLQGLVGSLIPQVLKGSKTFDPGSLADGASGSTTVTVTGAVVGNPVIAGFPFSAVFAVSAYVSAADTVTVVYINRSGGISDQGSGTLTAIVFK